MGRGRGGKSKRKNRDEKKENVWDPSKSQKGTANGGPANSNQLNSKTYWVDIEPRNEIYENYYKTIGICKDDTEWEQFMKFMGRPLPSTFRINTTIGSLQDVVMDQLKEIAEQKVDIEIDGEPITKMVEPIPWYPNQIAWRSSIPKKALRKNPTLAKFQQFLVHHDNQGNLTRQEAVSMIPPLFLDVQSHHHIVDMCAAPGSKTTQILEDLHVKIVHTKEGGQEKEIISIPTGSIIANDVDTNRCYTLAHQCARLGSPGIVISNHEAQNFPLLFDADDKPMFVDRILADVPCSGDGTNRKNPELWKKWTYASGIGLHNLQTKIATRAAQLLKVGGRMVYSTCSMNPVENEAVVAELLNRSQGSMRLVDVSAQYPQLIRAPGMYSWPVIDKEGTFQKFEDVPENKKYKLASSLFCPTPERAQELALQHCMRVYPHFQDTGGFFIAVLEKVADFPNQIGKRCKNTTESTETTESTTTESTTESTTTESNDSETTTTSTTTTTTPPNPNRKIKARDIRNKFFEEPFVLLKDDVKKEMETVVNFYGLKNFPCDNLLSRSDKSQKLYWVTDSVLNIVKNDVVARKLKIINTGLKVFQRHTGLGHMDCPYRVSQDAVGSIEPFMTKRVLSFTHDDLVLLFKVEDPQFNQFPAELAKQLTELEPGCFVIKISGNNRETPSSGMVFSAWRGKTSINLLVPKQEIDSLKGMYGVVDEKKDTTSTTTTATTDAKVESTTTESTTETTTTTEKSE
ncbi:hypothetical protein CYY_000496 [Polysphondylium violaceum]|uniref:SAM-dependent MTase RsmB/NOP-type domain-containing protein n=1 Tax=Polysphondylium violaceum TaxID=133409 RepID=A0A8J4QAV1_9MYCE|nr:hypothetical protein CYY_000496 [Polysphondylium violaceum]